MVVLEKSKKKDQEAEYLYELQENYVSALDQGYSPLID